MEFLMKTHALLKIALLLFIGSTHAVATTLDLVSGVDSILNGAITSFDTYDEDGFRIQMDRAGDHLDRNFIGDIAIHNGPTNQSNVSWTLTFGGSAFNLLDIDTAGLLNGASSFTLTDSNNHTQVVDSTGVTAISGMIDVTFVIFNIDQDQVAGIEAIGLNEITVSAVPVPATAWLFGSGLLGMLGWMRKK
jgi:hypothetical protein